jgi:hypothetical protein
MWFQLLQNLWRGIPKADLLLHQQVENLLGCQAGWTDVDATASG